MTWILGIMAVLCVAYYIVIVLYSGFATSFSIVWLFFSAFLFFLAAGAELYKRHPKRVPLWIPVSVVTVCAAGILIFTIVEVLVFMGVASVTTSNLDYLIVLGAKVREHEISDSLRKRLDKAIEYIEQNPDTILVLSGGQGPGESVTEAQAMYDYLTFNGVSGDQLLLETFSTSTVENIAYSRVAIEHDQEIKKAAFALRKIYPLPKPHEMGEDKPLEIGVLTSNFHVFRAMAIAKRWGIPDIHGIASESDPILFVHFCVRECAAILKDKLMGNM